MIMVAEKSRVIQKTPTGEIVRLWDSLREAAKSLDIKYQYITYACTKGVLAGGYLWEYADRVVEKSPFCHRHNVENNMCRGKHIKNGKLSLRCAKCEFYKE